jgi:hypothetical protein
MNSGNALSSPWAHVSSVLPAVYQITDIREMMKRTVTLNPDGQEQLLHVSKLTIKQTSQKCGTMTLPRQYHYISMGGIGREYCGFSCSHLHHCHQQHHHTALPSWPSYHTHARKLRQVARNDTSAPLFLWNYPFSIFPPFLYPQVRRRNKHLLSNAQNTSNLGIISINHVQ